MGRRPVASRISFSEVQLRAPYAPGSTPDPLNTTHLASGTDLARRALTAIVGDGDKLLEAGETGHVLASARSVLGFVGSTATLNGTEDPVKISAHGWTSATRAGALNPDQVLNYGNLTGFGVVGTGRLLDNGNSLTWTLNDTGGAAQHLDAVSFTVSTGLLRLPTVLRLDFDGDVIASGSYRATSRPTADTALDLSLRGGDAVRIDFEAQRLTVNGVDRSGSTVDAFFDAYEAGPQNAITIGGLGTLGPRIRDLTLDRSDVISNGAPSVMLNQTVASLRENADVRTPIKVADITVTDDGIGSNVLTLSGADAALFEIAGTELFLRAGMALDFETNPKLDVIVGVDDPAIGAPGTVEASAALSIAVGDVVEKWGAITLDGAVGEWGAATKLAEADGFALHGDRQDGAFLLALTSTGAPITTNTTLWLNTDLNIATGHKVWGWAAGAEYNVNFGPDGRPALYTGAAGETFVANLDYVFNAAHTAIEIALPAALLGEAGRMELYADVNDAVFLPGDYTQGLTFGENAAPRVALAQLVASLRENADVRTPIKVADITVTDDGIGSNVLTLSGADAALFEIAGTELFLRAGMALDFETNPKLDVIVGVDDPALGAPGTVEASAALLIAVGDVVEKWGAITLDGATADWAAATVLATRAEGGATYTLRGSYDAGAFLVSVESDGAPVGPNTTLWLNTDLNAATGHREFGTGPGAEFHIDFGADGTPALYTGSNRQTFVANLDYAYNSDHSTVEIALPSNLVGGATRLEAYGDITNAVFFPNPYGTGYTFGKKAAPLPVDPSERVAIVYSKTTADHYFDKTAYGQLFMSAQHQAMQAGLPFDVISETDLTDIAKLAGYDSIVFPGLSHVPAALLSDISNTLATASQEYGIGLVAMGNFLTNDETGAAIAGDSYARMKSLLGVTLDNFGTTSGVQIGAETGGHPVSDRYAANELVGSYANNSYLTFKDVSGGGQTLFTQTTDNGELSAVIATSTGGRNVHFATDAVFGNTNILQEAMKWSSLGDTPEAALKMTRGESLFFSRNDMDQSQELYDVVDQNPGIYDKMLPILEKWYADYGFVGSYYVNVGADPSEFQATDWSVSRPYYQRILALESEIGTHSYTHPHDTNLLLPDVITAEMRTQKIVPNPELQPLVSGLTLAQINQQMAAALAATNPAGSNPVPRSSLSPVQQALLEFSARFQFDYSRRIIERELGLEDLGAAVPGAPEKIDASFGILSHVDYLTGGYSGIGAGYPGAFGFLDPAHADKVYFAPNVSFDFSLIEFQNLSAAQAEAKWNAEFEQITDKGSTPIIHFPWHDYGPTNWATTPGTNAGYTEAMFTNFIARAYRSGTEFVTGKDLAARIETFVDTRLEIDGTQNGLRATVSGANLGSFSLETGSKIASVANWYAYDDDRVFLDSNGGVFDVTFGSQAKDVTHLVSLPMRTELISASGDGSDLTFAFEGRGAFKVALQTLGDRSVVTTGAGTGKLDGDVLTLQTDASGRQTMTVDYKSGAEIAGTGGANVIVLSDAGRRVDGGGGNDTLIAGSGNDTFVFRTGMGTDTVLKFDLADDRIDITDFGFDKASAALGSFTDGTDGATLSFSASESLVLADIRVSDLAENNFILNETLLT